MNVAPRLSSRAWLAVLCCAVGFLCWIDQQRAQRVTEVMHTDSADAAIDASSPTGYAGGKRWLIVPEHNNRGYRWIAETQQMFAKHEWRVRHTDAENAPAGRAVHTASPYRWWLGAIAWSDHAISGAPLGLAAERAALWADPLLHLLLLIGTTIFVARTFGNFPAILFALGLTTLFPLAGSFLPGVPDDRSLARCCALWSVLLLLAAIARKQKPSDHPGRRVSRKFFAAGVAGGLGLWIDPRTQAPVLLGIAIGGVAAALLDAFRSKTKPAGSIESTPWRTWAGAGAVTCLLAYLVEYFPAHLDLELQVNHPLYGLAWLGLGELLLQVETGIKHREFPRNPGRILLLAAALVAIAALPVAMALTKTPGILADPSIARITSLPHGAVAKNFSLWIARDGFSRAAMATLLPLLLLAAGLILLARKNSDSRQLTGIAFAAGPAIVALALACVRLAWWNTFDVLLLAGVVIAASGAAVANSFSRMRVVWCGLAAAAFLPGSLQLRLPAKADGHTVFTPFEIEGLIERAIAHWITDHAGAGKAVVLLPPDRTASWSFHGGWRGIGSESWENRDGLAATVRIVSATTADEAFALISERGITHLVLPSWDQDLDEFARWTVRNPEDAFIAALHHWALPPWLRPVPYNLPEVSGFEGQSVVVLAVAEESNPALSLSRLAEYFIETKQPDRAAAIAAALERFPTDFGAMTTRALVAKARGDQAQFEKTFAALLSSLTAGLDRSLPWDRRVSLAIVLAQGGRNDLARVQVQRCLEKLDDARLRSLTTASLFRLLILSKAFSIPFSTPPLHEEAEKLLPPELRAQL